MINILVTLNANYIPPLKVMLKSLFENNAEVNFSIYIMHSQIPDHKMNEIHEFVTAHQHQLHPISVPTDFFNDAPTFRHYTTEMYYRLACHHFLPEEVDRILYLDPDIVVINPITAFYETDFGDHLFVAAEHEHTARLAQGINKLRLKASLSKGYVNTGVLLMNVARMRKQVHLDEIYAFIEKNKMRLVLPDQDVLNALYGDQVIPVDSYIYNYDARYFELAKLSPSAKNKQKSSLYWIRKHTIFIHYCGKDKPWHEDYKGTLGIFYKKYADMIETQNHKLSRS